MGSSAFERFIQSTGGQRPVERSGFDQFIDATGGADPAQLREAVRRAEPAAADRTARVLQLTQRTQLPQELVDRNLDVIEQQSRAADFDPEKFKRESPVVAQWMAEHPNNASVAGDDIPQLSKLEHIFLALAGPQRMRTALTVLSGRRAGLAETEVGQIGYAALQRGSLSEPERQRVDRLEREIASTSEGRSFLNRLVFGSSKIIGQLEASLPYVGTTTLAGATGFGVLGSIAGPVGTGVGAAAGATFGAAAGIATHSQQVEAGHAYLAMSKIRDENGVTIDEDTKQSVALGVGFLNGLLEATGAAAIAAPFKTVAKKFARETVKTALVRPTMRAALADFGKSYALALAGETATEVGQEVTAIVGEEIAKWGSEGQFASILNDPEELEGAVFRLRDIVQQTVEGMALLALPGASIHGASSAYAAQKATQREQFYLQLGETMAESKTFQRLPDAVEGLIARATADGPISTVYAPVETWDTYWQSKRLDPRAVAEDLGVAEQWEEAQRTGGDIAIPIQKYATKIAPTEHNAFFANELRARPNEMNAREAVELRQELEKAQSEALADKQPVEAAGTVGTRVSEMLTAAGVDESTAKSYASIYESAFRTLGERAGIDPLELFDRYNVSIGRQQDAPVAPAGPRVNLQEIADRAIAMREREAERAAISGETGQTYAAAAPYMVEPHLRDMESRNEAGEFVYARRASGAMRSNLSKVATDGLIDELVIMLEAQNQDANLAIPTVESPEQADPRANFIPHVGMKGAAVNASGRLKNRKISIDKIEAELARRGVENLEARIVERFTGQSLDPEFTAFQANIQKYVAWAQAADDPEISEEVRAFARDRAKALEPIARAEYQGEIEDAKAEYEMRTGERWLYQSGLDQPLLSGLHNLTAGNLIAADRLGGLPAPSLALVPEAQPFAQYGDITLIARRSAVDPQQVPVFDSDAYTGRAPKPEFKARPWREISALMSPLAATFASVDDMGSHGQIVHDLVEGKPFEAEAHFLRSLGGQVAFLEERAIQVEKAQRDVPLHESLSDDRTLVEFFKENGVDYGARPGDAYWARLTGAILLALDRAGKRSRLRDRYIDEDGQANFGPAYWLMQDQEKLGKREPDSAAIRESVESAMASQREAYDAWVAERIAPFKRNPRIKVGRRFEPYNLDSATESAVRARAIAGAEETMTFGPGKARAVSSTRFSNMQHARNASYQIQHPEQVRAAIEAADQELSAWRDRMLSSRAKGGGFGDTWDALDNMHRGLARYIKRNPVPAKKVSAMRQALAAVGFTNLSSELVDESIGIAEKIRDMPVDYFEAKPQRAVRFDEFGGAVIPKDATSAVREILDRRRIPYREYSNAADRAAALKSFRRELYSSGVDVLYQRADEGKRGKFRARRDPTGRPIEISIELLADANLSTFLHETGHFYLELLADLARDQASPDIVRDLDTIRTWLGAEGEGFTVEQHEQFARGFEQYLMEGKAPSAELRSSFARFRAWLVSIYKRLENLRTFLSDDVRLVFDRLLASEEEIAAAEREQNMHPMFPDPRAVGMNEQQAAEYQAAVEDARHTAEDELTRKLVADIQREQSAVYKAERAKVRAEIVDEVNTERDYVAQALMSRGTLPDGSPLPAEFEPFKLSKAALEAEYASRYPNLLRRLRYPKFLYAKEGGIHPDQAAEILGYASGDELIAAMLDLHESGRERIERLTTERLRQDDPNLVTAAELPVEAMKAVHNEKRSRVLHRELAILVSDDFATFKKLTKRVARRLPPLPEVRAEAERIVAGKKVRDINPLLYQRAEERSARLAVDALLKGDIEQAFDEKQRELLNHELYRAATKAKDEVDRVTTDLARFGTKPVRERLGKAGSDYLAQIDGILDRFDFRKGVSYAQLDRRRALREWYQEQVDAGLAPPIPEKILDEAFRTHYKELTLAELRDVAAAVDSIEHLARLKNRLLASARERELDKAREEIITSLGTHHSLKRDPAGHPPETLRSRLHKGALKGLAEHTRMEFLFDFLDGYKGGVGIVWEYLFKPFTDAETAENDMRRQNADEMRRLFAPYTRAERGDWYTKKVFIPVARSSKHDGNFTKAAIIAAALNWGNDYNRDALMAGYDWTLGQVEAILEQLDQRDWTLVQGIWDHINSYWPQVAKLEEDLVGVAPPQVEATPFATKAGVQMKGGYYPIIFDRERSLRQAKYDERASVTEMFGGNWARAMTRHGHTIERTNTGGKALKLELGGLVDHLEQVVHDLAYRRAVIDVHRLINDDDISKAIATAAGTEMYEQLGPWLHAIAGDRVRGYSNFYERLLGNLRQGATVVGLGLKVTSAALQSLGYTLATDELGPKYAAAGVRAAYGNIRKIRETWAFITQRSAMMRDRLENYDRDVRDYARKQDVIDGAQMAWFAFIGWMDLGTSIPSWLGAYRKAMDGALEGVEKGDELKAIAYADKVVRETQAAGAAKDLAAIQRGSESWRLFTMFYSSMSILFNQFDRARRHYQIEKNLPQLVAAMALIWFVPVLLEQAIRGNEPDDDEGWASFLAKKLAAYPFATVIGVRDVVGSLDRYRFSGSPVGEVGETMRRAILALAKPFTDGVINRTDWKALASTVGYWAKLPAAQLWKTGEYLVDWLTGIEAPSNPLEGLYRATVTGKPRSE